ncbi:MAG: Glu-tRNA(Gln) amidotransferase subunit GatE, partial [Candidatus Thorarchaeota archaeon]
DVNISIKGGGIIEVKGLQQLDMLATVVEYEALRQEHLLEISKKLVRKGVTESDFEVKPVNVSHIFVKSESNVIRNALKSDGKVYALKLPGFAGLVGTEIQPERRLGTEFSDYAQFWGGVGGIFHTDELPKYGITTSNVSQLRKFLGAKEQDALIIVAAAEENCIDALNAVVERAKDALIGVPAETRTPLPNGTTKYARPRPGAERMYPETDVRPVKITESRLKRITKEMPETLESKEKRFVKEHGLSEELASQVVRSYNLELFEQIVADIDIAPTIIASTLENTLVSLHRDGAPSENLQDRHFIELFGAVSNNTVSSDAIPEILTYLSNNPDSGFEEALSSTGLGKIETTEVEKIIQKIVEQKIDFIREQGERATGALMGIAMKELRGKADGKIVKDLLAAEVNRILTQ